MRAASPSSRAPFGTDSRTLLRRANADALLADHSFLTDDIKAAIIERAEAESSDEEEDDETEAFAEDFDGGATFKVQDTGDDADDSNEEVNEGTATPTPVVRFSSLSLPCRAS